MKILRFTALSCLVLALGVIYSCSDSNSSTSGTVNYSGPGSYYDVSMDYDNNMFEMDVYDEYNGTLEFSIDGSFERLSTGFLKLTVENSSDTDNGPSAGDQAFAMDLPGFALIVKPIGDGNDEVIPMLAGGSCPSEEVNLNWIIAQGHDEKDPSAANQEWFGGFTWDGNGSAEVTSDYSLADNFPSPDNAGGFDSISCDNGFAQIIESNEVQANLWLTAGGGAMVETFDSGDRNQTILALPQQEVATSNLEGSYYGLVLGGGDGPEPVQVILDNSGSGTGAAYTDVESGDVDSESVNIDLDVADSAEISEDGWFTGTISAGSTSGNMACSGAVGVGDLNQTILFCVGQDPGGDADGFFGVMLASVPE